MTFEQEMEAEALRALSVARFFDWLAAPSPTQLWLEDAAARLALARDPDGSKAATKKALLLKLVERDGTDCWYCGRALGQDITFEHLNPRALGGSWKVENMALAHKGCNKAAGHMTRHEKELLRAEMRAKIAAGEL